ncbi:MAG: shikimate kinase [Candidatus Korobacteraceae bacterium]
MARRSQPARPNPPPIIALTGFMAVGKSTVGRILGSLVHWNFLDLDYEIECRSHMHIHEIFAMQGEQRFREIEADALRRIIEHAAAPTVIALGGGTFVQPDNADLLIAHGAHVVFLELEIGELLARCRSAREGAPQNPRPLADDAQGFCSLYERRLPSYRKAVLTVHTKGKSAEQVAREIAAALHLSLVDSADE